MIGIDQISEVMRYTDAESEEFLDMPRFWRERDVDTEAITHAAMQHGLRVVMAMKGMNPTVTRVTAVALSHEEQATQRAFAASWMNGVGVGFDLSSKHGSH